MIRWTTARRYRPASCACLVLARPSCATVANPACPGRRASAVRITRSCSRRVPHLARALRAAATARAPPCRSARPQTARPATPTARSAPPRQSPATRSNLPATSGVETPPCRWSITRAVFGPMKKYRCSVCGHIYDPAAGEPEAGIAPGTPFEALPDSWRCPDCGMDKSAFEELSE